LWPAASNSRSADHNQQQQQTPWQLLPLSLAYCSAAAVFFLRMWISEEKKKKKKNSAK
jgi:hypothetical protein